LLFVGGGVGGGVFCEEAPVACGARPGRVGVLWGGGGGGGGGGGTGCDMLLLTTSV